MVEVEALRMETYQSMSLNRFGKEAAAGLLMGVGSKSFFFFFIFDG
jgi:hypothetical protein